MADLQQQLQDVNSLIEATKQQALAEQERARLENDRLEEEKLRRIAEEGRVLALKALIEKVDLLLHTVQEIKPTVEIMARNGDTIAEILRILASNIPHMSEKDVETVTAHIASVMAAQQSRFHTPVNVYTGTQYESKKDLTINTQGNQYIG